MNVELLFQGAEHDALDEVLLEERIREHHRDGGEHDDRISHLEGTHLLLVVTSKLFVGEVHHVFNRRIIKDQQAAQIKLQRTPVVFSQIQLRLEPAVPHTNDRIQRDSGLRRRSLPLHAAIRRSCGRRNASG